MSTFYTYAKQWGNNILYKGYRNGKLVIEKVPYKPTLFVRSKDVTTKWRGFYDGTLLEPIRFDSIKEAKRFIDEYDGVAGFEVHGFQKFEYQLINEWHAGDVPFDKTLVDIHTIDIEVVDEDADGFPDIQEASVPIVLISHHSSLTGITTVFGLRDYNKSDDDTFVYKRCNTEHEMLSMFISFHSQRYPDAWTGWNIDGFDIPYMINRMMNVLGEVATKRLSPFGVLREKMLEIRGKEVQTFEIFGVPSLDYLELYKKFGTYSQKESYALDFIAEEELGENKVELPGSSFRDNYNNHFDIFVRYNAKDTIIVKKLDDKLKLIDLAFALMNTYHCNISDIYRTVLPWEVFIFNRLMEKNIPVPPKKDAARGNVEGAWVKEGTPGLYDWVMSFDFTSLYPSTIRQWNISPETMVESPWVSMVKPQDFLTASPVSDEAISWAKENNYSLAANGAAFMKDKKGILPELMEYCMVQRKVFKDEMLSLEAKYEETKDETLQNRISALSALEQALKRAANSGYGAIGNVGFHYYDYRMAEAITLSGQLSNRYLLTQLNDKLNSILKTDSIDFAITGDTDSLYLHMVKIIDAFMPNESLDNKVKFLDEIGKKVCQPVINKSVGFIFDKMNAYDKVIGSKREAIASKMLFRAKKNYAIYVHNSEGVQYAKPKLKVKGLEIVKSTTPKWCRERIKDLLLIVMTSSEKELQRKFSEYEKEFSHLPPEVIGINRGVSDIGKYFINGKFIDGKTLPIHVRAAGVYNILVAKNALYQQVQKGDKIKFLYMKVPNPVKSNVIGFPSSGSFPSEYNLSKYIDYDTQFEKTFESPIKSLTDIAGWNLREKVDLDDFFA